jgi:ubiquinone/menaquinone biosynthesis C-methylase UbiE
MNKKQMKFENPLRLEELKPKETLQRIGLRGDHVLCDIGAGSGIFTIPAAKITKNIVYALEINDEMLSVIEDKANNEGISNIELIKVHNDHFDLEDGSVDIILMVTVLHEIQNKHVVLEEVKRLLNNSGKSAVIEFHKRETPMGPPPSHRMGKNEVKDLFGDLGFTVIEDFDLGDNFYCLVFSV